MKRLEIDFEGRTVLIAGAATGIGRATALAFAAARASVVIGDVDPQAEGTASDIVAAGGKAVFQKTRSSRQARGRREPPFHGRSRTSSASPAAVDMRLQRGSRKLSSSVIEYQFARPRPFCFRHGRTRSQP